ncbi:hypothetical protein TNCT_645841 [Trichonephila clavata]|uniref:Uncharacterized protein n=1 Tax=Trichonephila clavata TaxID=2740835 RepID=A0A8X6FS36_TRICU|nr:hypothetical protein TNCT_645841 [Trichonephila clavata]
MPRIDHSKLKPLFSILNNPLMKFGGEYADTTIVIVKMPNLLNSYNKHIVGGDHFDWFWLDIIPVKFVGKVALVSFYTFTGYGYMVKAWIIHKIFNKNVLNEGVPKNCNKTVHLKGL